MSGSQSIFNGCVVIKDENISSGEECTILRKQLCEGNPFESHENSKEVNMLGLHSISRFNQVLIKEESISSNEDCTIPEEEQCGNSLTCYERLNEFQPPDTIDVQSLQTYSPENNLDNVKTESLIFDSNYSLIDKEKRENGFEAFGKLNCMQLNRDSGHELMNIDSSLNHHVFIKEEINYDDEVYSNNISTEELTYHRPPEDNMFGSHFLAPSFEPLYQYANGQSAEGETSLVNESLLDHLPLTSNIDQAQFTGANPFPCFSTSDKKDSNRKKRLCTGDQTENEMGKMKFCKLCQFSTRNMTLMRLHRWGTHQEVTSPPLSCQYCLFQCQTKQSLQQHIFNKHNFGQIPIDCPYCKFKSLSILEVENHIQAKHHKEKKYFHCPHCEYKNSNSGNVRYHIAARHTKEKSFLCPICGYKCIQLCNIKKHILKIHNKKINNVSLLTIPLPNKVSEVQKS